MKKVLSLLFAVITAMMFTLQASATEGVTPSMGDHNSPWLWMALAAVAVIMVIVIIVTGKRR